MLSSELGFPFHELIVNPTIVQNDNEDQYQVTINIIDNLQQLESFENQGLAHELKERSFSLFYPGNGDKKHIYLYENINYLDDGVKSRKQAHGLGKQAAQKLLELKVQQANIKGHALVNNEKMLAYFLNSFILANFKYEHKDFSTEEQLKKKFKPIQKLNIINSDLKISETEEIRHNIRSAVFQLYNRAIANTRANVFQVSDFVKLANAIKAQYENIKVTTIVGKELEEKQHNLHYSVGKGASDEPALLNFFYEGNPDNKEDIYALVGKGIVFDAGGLNIKPTGSMEGMFLDKHGATTVLTTFLAVVDAKLPINLTCSLGMAQNLLGSNAYRPSDIIKSLKGLTVDIGNTDAEGRLVLADTMTWTQRTFKPHTLIEASTLTGACMIALGANTAGLFTNSDELGQKLLKASEQSNERLWRLPILDEFRDELKSEVSDLNSIGTPYGGACKAAAFLEYFVEKDVKWSHIDIAGPSGVIPSKNATGFGTQLLYKYLLNECKQKQQ